MRSHIWAARSNRFVTTLGGGLVVGRNRTPPVFVLAYIVYAAASRASVTARTEPDNPYGFSSTYYAGSTHPGSEPSIIWSHWEGGSLLVLNSMLETAYTVVGNAPLVSCWMVATNPSLFWCKRSISSVYISTSSGDSMPII